MIKADDPKLKKRSLICSIGDFLFFATSSVKNLAVQMSAALRNFYSIIPLKKLLTFLNVRFKCKML